LSDDRSLGFDWDEARGRKGMEAALALIDGLARHPSSALLSGVVSPMQIENCSDDLLRDSLAAANDRKIPFTLHVAQGVLEHLEMIKRHGVTPIRHARDLGILGPTSVIAHAILPDTHSWIRWCTNAHTPPPPSPAST